jgi:hypothetical protein
MLFFVFSRGIAAEFPTGKLAKWGFRLLTIIAIKKAQNTEGVKNNQNNT